MTDFLQHVATRDEHAGRGVCGSALRTNAAYRRRNKAWLPRVVDHAEGGKAAADAQRPNLSKVARS